VEIQEVQFTLANCEKNFNLLLLIFIKFVGNKDKMLVFTVPP